MANTYSQLSVHCVFAVKGRANIIAKEWRDELHQYISGIIKGLGATSLAVGGWNDHVHIFFGLPVTRSIADLVGAIKANSSKWINEKKLVTGKFHWQNGYGAFSYSKSQRNAVINYIIRQEAHHRRKTFKEEYLQMLTDFDIAYDEKYLFEFID